MSDERRERWADIFINIPVYDDYTLSKATDAAMAVADAELDAVNADFLEAGNLREENDRLLTKLDYATERREHHWEEVKRLRAELKTWQDRGMRTHAENARLRADRAAVLREAADVAEDEALRWPEPHQIEREQGALDVMAQLRRMADEAQQAGPTPVGGVKGNPFDYHPEDETEGES